MIIRSKHKLEVSKHSRGMILDTQEVALQLRAQSECASSDFT